MLSIFFLQVFPLPVFAGNDSAAVLGAALAFHPEECIINHGIVQGQLLSRFDPAHRDVHDLTADSHVRFAGVIYEHHDSLPFLLLKWGGRIHRSIESENGR